MDLADNIINKIDLDAELKSPVNALICFSKPQTGNALGILINEILAAKPDKSSITAVHLIDEVQAQHIGDIEVYKNELFSQIIAECEHNHITIRTFIKTSDDFVDDILHIAEEQDCNLLLLGIGSNVFNKNLWKKYMMLKSNPVNSEDYINEQFEVKEARSLKNVSSLLQRNQNVTAVFIDNGFNGSRKVFIPVLDKEDTYIFPYVYQLSLKPEVSIMIWDAIGILQNSSIQKMYQYIVKKSDGRVALWNNNKKIEYEFIRNQDLMIIGIQGWDKLISSALPWTTTLPSTLIIKK
ncbi:MAG TPA: hypothetical protein DDZ96_03020 [Porphyromonadaceae bacterium]|jgi:hypothetical protein|uniref:hypothetical protein n=1 Tax=Limibacterium fermenti TaxID=3229863 RepID=UPI000E87528D|nr:hypothetical protein [Porphyromonadaceae bacterium]HBK30561.1 hypothetical protein [Porphyromonadaceae bacterium]HBL32778.1 hypothetical protein [Porphyromonadaceae bacterium]HBX19458.1 hypothetical protein [Porphyromonadaceae bacterium]HBX46911.1 hypothetical protein [Porphyromonadaceae bacterium]